MHELNKSEMARIRQILGVLDPRPSELKAALFSMPNEITKFSRTGRRARTLDVPNL
jgi:hypothetical protein